MRKVALLIALVFVVGGWAQGPSPAALNDAHQWLAAKFLSQPASAPAVAQMIPTNRSRPILKGNIRGRKFTIHNQQFDRGIHMPLPGEILVRLPAPATSFEAVVGVDSNDLGYYSHGGRGSLVASVETAGKELFRTPIMKEGIPGIPVKIELSGAAEFKLKLAAVGQKGLTHQAEWDQVDWAQARVRLADGQWLWLEELPVGPMAGAASTDLPFSFRYNGRSSAEFLKSWTMQRAARQIDRNRTEHTLAFKDPQTSLEVRAVAVEYRDFPVVEWTLFFKNGGSADTPILEDIQALEARIERNLEGEFLLHHGKGSPNSPTDYQPLETPLGRKVAKRIATTGGRPTDSDLCYFNIEWPGQGVIVALGWPGQWAAQFTRDDGAGLQVRAGQELTHFTLHPGEQVRSPLVAVLFWRGDWIAGQNVWRRWMVAHNLPRPGGKLPPPQIAAGSNRYTIEMQEATEANQKQYLEAYLKQGLKLDYWWMDAGWYPFKTGWWNVGTWFPDPARFPSGFRPVSDLAHSKGIKIIVWFEPERVQSGSWLYEKHPEWLLGPEGKDKLLYLGNPEAWQWLVEHVSGLLRKDGIDLYRQDFNFPPLAIWRANDAPDRQGITEIKHVTGYLAYWDELRRRIPGLLIDTCASGGRRNDLETLRRAVPLWRSDHAFDPASMQQLTYGMSLWIPYFGTAINASDPYIFFSQMTPAVALGAEPTRADIDGKLLLRQLDKWREVAGSYYGDYYPLTSYSTDGSAWMAWQFDQPGQDKGMIQAFRRPESPFESARFKLRGLKAGATYAVSEFDGAPTRTIPGSELMERGLPVTISKRPGAVLITYQAAR